MVRKQNINNNLPKRGVKPFSKVADFEYDLEKNFKRINSYSKNKRNKDKSNALITDSGESESNIFLGNRSVELPNNSSISQRTGDSTAWNSYVRLDDKITDYNYKNDQAHTDLRRELESKIKDSNTSFGESIKECKDAISKRLHMQWYAWTIIGLVAIVSIWYLFSYQDVHPLPKHVQDIDKRLNNIEKNLDSQKSPVD